MVRTWLVRSLVAGSLGVRMPDLKESMKQHSALYTLLAAVVLSGLGVWAQSITSTVIEVDRSQEAVLNTLSQFDRRISTNEEGLRQLPMKVNDKDRWTGSQQRTYEKNEERLAAERLRWVEDKFDWFKQYVDLRSEMNAKDHKILERTDKRLEKALE